MAKDTDNWLHDTRINIYDIAEVKFWARQFAVSEAQLMQAVDRAGTGIRAVRELLRNATHPARLKSRGGDRPIF
jgi:hypothetical protein